MKKVMTGLRFIFRTAKHGQSSVNISEIYGSSKSQRATVESETVISKKSILANLCVLKSTKKQITSTQVTSIWADLSKACSIALLAIKTSKKWISCTKMRITQNPTSSLKSTASISLTKHWTLTDSTMNTNLHSFHPKTNYIS